MTGSGGDSRAAARQAWAAMNELVLDHERRQELSRLTGLPFSRVRALQRIVPAPVTVGELATALGVDPPNCTPIVDDLEKRGLAERQPHPSDRRRKLVVATPAGTRLARLSQDLVDSPPAALEALPAHDLRALAEILELVRQSSR